MSSQRSAMIQKVKKITEVFLRLTPPPSILIDIQTDRRTGQLNGVRGRFSFSKMALIERPFLRNEPILSTDSIPMVSKYGIPMVSTHSTELSESPPPHTYWHSLRNIVYTCILEFTNILISTVLMSTTLRVDFRDTDVRCFPEGHDVKFILRHMLQVWLLCAPPTGHIVCW